MHEKLHPYNKRCVNSSLFIIATFGHQGNSKSRDTASTDTSTLIGFVDVSKMANLTVACNYNVRSIVCIVLRLNAALIKQHINTIRT